MAEARGHKFGQTLGEYCQHAMEPFLQEFADRHGLYLDKQGTRAVRGTNKKVRWTDQYGNAHDLDYVLERGGSEDRIGTPVAFIEAAWRRYTKHSKNKAQEIQGAVMPIRDKHRYSAPFAGCVLVGEYTSTAREQLRSLGFHVLHFDYPTLLAAAQTVGIDASYAEETPDEEFAAKQVKWDKLKPRQREQLWAELVRLNSKSVNEFMAALDAAVKRKISIVRIVPLHGTAADCASVQEAIEFVATYSEAQACEPLLKYEVQIRYNNGDRIDAQFQDKPAVVEFLEHYQSGNWTPVTEEDESAASDVLGTDETESM